MNIKQFSVFALLLAVLIGTQSPAHASDLDRSRTRIRVAEDVVLRWNRVLIETLLTPGQQPSTIVAGRSLAIVHAAIFDAVNSIDGSYKPYLTDVPGSKHASVDAAAAKAARDVLSSLYPSRTTIFDAEFAASIAGLEENRAQQGIRVGEFVAQRILEARSNDGWTADRPIFVLPATPGNWQPTPPANAAAALTHFPNVVPFALTSGTQFMPPPPPALASAAYATALNEVKELGYVNSSTRTADQTQQAQAWAAVGNPTSAPIVWNRIAGGLAVSKGNTTVENARMFALLNISHHDAFLTTFASKYHYGVWRPVTAIRRADEDGNANTEADPAWSSLITTPPYPTYAGNMATIGWSNAAMLGLFFGRDDLPVQYTFPTGATRSYMSLSAVAEEMGRSRIYGGIHFEFDSDAGRSIGMNTSNYVFLNVMRPRSRGAALIPSTETHSARETIAGRLRYYLVAVVDLYTDDPNHLKIVEYVVRNEGRCVDHHHDAIGLHARDQTFGNGKIDYTGHRYGNIAEKFAFVRYRYGIGRRELAVLEELRAAIGEGEREFGHRGSLTV